MVVVESSMAGGRKEVALAAITLLSAVLQAHGSITDIVSPAMWSRAVRALGVGVEAATSPACMVPLLVSLSLGLPACLPSWAQGTVVGLWGEARSLPAWAQGAVVGSWGEASRSFQSQPCRS